MTAKIYRPTKANLEYLAARLRQGELVAIPTETVYGLAADALNAIACRKIFTAKRRPANDPLIVHVLGLKQAEELAEFSAVARKVARKFWPGPLTLVLPKKKCVPAIVTSGGNTVAIRAPAHRTARALLRLAQIPLAAPSANSFGYISPTETAHVVDGLGNRIDYIIEGGRCSLGVESTILDLTDPARPTILRPGTISASDVHKLLNIEIASHSTAAKLKDQIRQRAPGMLSRHYSPRTPLTLECGAAAKRRGEVDVGFIYVRKPTGKVTGNTYWLSKRGALREIARNLYRVLRQADSAGHKRIIMEPIPAGNGALEVTINDRLKRAAARR